MKSIPTFVWLCAASSLLGASAASAQVASPATEKFYVNVNVGGQLADRTLGSSTSQAVYGETATLTSSQPVAKGMTFDFGGGYRIWHDLYVGIVVTRFSDTADATYTASVPDPVVFGRPRTVTGTETTLDRSEIGFNPHVTWVRPLTDKFDIALGVGASFITLKQRLVNNFQVPVGSQAVVPLIGEETATGKGVFAQADFIYSLAARYGVGGFIRYAGGKADLPSSPDHNVGGMQAGGGIRLRF